MMARQDLRVTAFSSSFRFSASSCWISSTPSEPPRLRPFPERFSSFSGAHAPTRVPTGALAGRQSDIGRLGLGGGAFLLTQTGTVDCSIYTATADGSLNLSRFPITPQGH